MQKSYRLLLITKSIDTNATKVAKNIIMNNKYRQNLDSTKKSTTDAIKTASKRAVQKTNWK